MEKKKKILLIDDSTIIHGAVIDELSGEYHISCFEGFEDYMKASREVRNDTDLMLLDVNIPGSPSGSYLCRLFKKDDPYMRVLLFSDRSAEELRALTQECGSDGYIKKPGPGQLKPKISQFFRGLHDIKKGRKFYDGYIV